MLRKTMVKSAQWRGAMSTVRLIHSTAFGAKSPLLSNESQHSQYAGLTVKTLRKELAKRNLKTGGVRKELLERLASDDIFRNASTATFTIKIPRGDAQTARRMDAGFTTSTKPGQETAMQVESEEVVPAAIPKPWELSNTEKELPIRVPYLPENDFARYHRHEVVPKVAPPMKPIVSTTSADSLSTLSAVTEVVDNTDLSMDEILHTGELEKETSRLSGVWEHLKETVMDILPDVEPRGPNLFSPPNDEGEPMTETKKVALQVFSVASLAWWFTGIF